MPLFQAGTVALSVERGASPGQQFQGIAEVYLEYSNTSTGIPQKAPIRILHFSN